MNLVDPTGYYGRYVHYELTRQWALEHANDIVAGVVDIADCVLGFGILSFFLTIPLLLLLNLLLVFSPSRTLKILSGILSPMLFLVACSYGLRVDPAFRGVGFWAMLSAPFIYVFVEVVLALSERRARIQG